MFSHAVKSDDWALAHQPRRRHRHAPRGAPRALSAERRAGAPGRRPAAPGRPARAVPPVAAVDAAPGGASCSRCAGPTSTSRPASGRSPPTVTKQRQVAPAAAEPAGGRAAARAARGRAVLAVRQARPCRRSGRPGREVLRDAGITDLRVHDLRHWHASLLASMGLSLPIIGALLGHASTATTQRYAHLVDDALRAATDRVGAAVHPAAQGRAEPWPPSATGSSWSRGRGGRVEELEAEVAAGAARPSSSASTEPLAR